MFHIFLSINDSEGFELPELKNGFVFLTHLHISRREPELRKRGKIIHTIYVYSPCVEFSNGKIVNYRSEKTASDKLIPS